MRLPARASGAGDRVRVEATVTHEQLGEDYERHAEGTPNRLVHVRW